MANQEQIALLRQGVDTWNRWREGNHGTRLNLQCINLQKANLQNIDFHNANLQNANLQSAKLQGANLQGANLQGANLQGAFLWKANLQGAFLGDTNLQGARLQNAKLQNAKLQNAHLYNANLWNAKFQNNADLRGSSLQYADLQGVNLQSANLQGVNLQGVNLQGAYLQGANLQGVNLQGAYLQGVNLQGAYLQGAHLQHVDLTACQALRANFTGANLTGACIADWHIGSSTILKDVECDYIFRTYDEETGQYSGRLPVDSDSTFAPGEFTKWLQIIASALETIDITFTDGINWQAFFNAFQAVRQQYAEHNVSVQGMEQKGDAFIVRLSLETEVTGANLDQLRGDIETTQKQLYSTQLALSAAKGELKVYRKMMGVVETLAEKQMGDQHFHGPVGNVANTNHGTMTAYIHQNSQAIHQLVSTLREQAQAFPTEQRDEVLIELDDIESDLKTPERQDPKRLGMRLKRLVAAGTAAAAIAGGAATFSGNLNTFTDNVLELSEKIGLSRDAIQPDQPSP
jgi:uncharacterized protein YjbI with pentapeptide repeats